MVSNIYKLNLQTYKPISFNMFVIPLRNPILISSLQVKKKEYRNYFIAPSDVFGELPGFVTPEEHRPQCTVTDRTALQMVAETAQNTNYWFTSSLPQTHDTTTQPRTSARTPPIKVSLPLLFCPWENDNGLQCFKWKKIGDDTPPNVI